MTMDLAADQQSHANNSISDTDSNPICECMRIVLHRMASMTGFKDPAAKGAIVSGMSATETSLEIASVSNLTSGSEGASGTSQMSNGSSHVLATVQALAQDHSLYSI